MNHTWRTAWQGQDIVVFHDEAEVDRLNAGRIERIVFVYAGSGDSVGDLQYAVVETVAQLSESDGLLGREARLPSGTVLVWGEKDSIFPLVDARHAASRIPGARLLVVTGVGPFSSSLAAVACGCPAAHISRAPVATATTA